METFVHTIAHCLNLSSIAYCKKFDGENDYLVLGNGSILNFYQFQHETPIFEFNYHLFGDIALLIPYNCDGVMILIVILSSTKFCVLHYEKGQIICDQKGQIEATSGANIGSNFSYSLFKSLLLIQIFQENLQIYRIMKKKLIFIQVFSFFTSIIYRFQLISSNQFVALQNKYEFANVYEIYNFDIIAQEKCYEFVAPNEFNNFLRQNKNDILISKKKFIEIKEKKSQTVMEINLNEDIFDVIQLKDDLYFVVTNPGKILLIEKLNDQKSKITKIGEVCRPLKIIVIGKNHFIIPSKYGETKYFSLKGSQYNLKTLFVFPGKATKFVKLSERSFLGLTLTNHVHRVEKTLCLNDLYDYQFESKNKCWFIDEKNILFSTENFTKVLNFHDRIENTEFDIQKDVETVGFQLIFGDNYIQITKNLIYINNKPLKIQFSNISLVKFSNCAFCFVDDLTHLFILSLIGDIIFQYEFSFQINSITLYSDELLAVSSWESSLILLINIKNSNEDYIEIIHEFTNMQSVDLLFRNDGEMIYVLSSKNEVHFINSHDFSIKTIYCKGNFNKFYPISQNEIIISGSKSYIIKDQIITEILGVEPFLEIDCYNDLLLFCTMKNLLSIKKRQKSYQFQLKAFQAPFKLIDVVEFDKNLNAVVLKNEENKINLALATNVLDFKNYKISPHDYKSKRKFKNKTIIKINDIVSNKPFIVVLFDTKISAFQYDIMNPNLFSKKSSFKFDAKPVGLTNIERNIFCLILVDKFYVFSLEEGIAVKLSYFYTLGASISYSYMNKKLLIGDLIESLVVYEYQENKMFNEIFRECHEFGCPTCAFINDELILCGDSSGYIYQVKTSKIKNFASNSLIIEKACSIGSNTNSMIYCNDLNEILIGTSNGEIVECKQIECPEIFQKFFDLIEKSVVSVGGFESAPFRRCICGSYFLKIPRIYDTDLLKTFIELNEEQKVKIIQKNDFDLSLEDAELICNQILNSE